MPVIGLGGSKLPTYLPEPQGRWCPALRTFTPRRSQSLGIRQGPLPACLVLLASDCCATRVRICTLAFGTVVIEGFRTLTLLAHSASLLGHWEKTVVLGELLRVDSAFRAASPLLCAAVSRVAWGCHNVHRSYRG